MFRDVTLCLHQQSEIYLKTFVTDLPICINSIVMKQEIRKQPKQLATAAIAFDELLLTMGWKDDEIKAKEAFASLYAHFGNYLRLVCEKTFEKYRHWYNASLIDFLFDDVMLSMYEKPDVLLVAIDGKPNTIHSTIIKVELGKLAEEILLKTLIKAEDPYRKHHISYDSTSTMHLLNAQCIDEHHETEEETEYRSICESVNDSKEEIEGELNGEFVSHSSYNWVNLDASEEEDVQDSTLPESYEVIISIAREILTEREFDILTVSLEFGSYHKYLPPEIVDQLCKRWQTTDDNVRQLRSRSIKKIRAHFAKKRQYSDPVERK